MSTHDIKNPSDILEALMIKNKESGDDHMNDVELFEEMSTFLFAGTDTTSSTLNIILYLIK